MTTPRPSSTPAGRPRDAAGAPAVQADAGRLGAAACAPPGGCGPAWERPGARPAASIEQALDRIATLFSTLGQRAYSGEPVSQLEHALQSAMFAQAEGAAEPLVAAALLHDIGHLVNDQGETPSARGIDDLHQFHGAHFLRPLFGSDVLEPIRLHVQAKRYLCSVRPGYQDALSPDSQRSLALQGDALDAAAAETFSQTAFAGDAVRLRLWDDAAKVAGLVTPPLSSLLPLLARCAKQEISPC
jgi:phosphonate degradation associated HDIG domain protein